MRPNARHGGATARAGRVSSLPQLAAAVALVVAGTRCARLALVVVCVPGHRVGLAGVVHHDSPPLPGGIDRARVRRGDRGRRVGVERRQHQGPATVPPRLPPTSANACALALTPALIFHLLMTLPDGRLARPAHRAVRRRRLRDRCGRPGSLCSPTETTSSSGRSPLLWAAAFLAAPDRPRELPRRRRRRPAADAVGRLGRAWSPPRSPSSRVALSLSPTGRTTTPRSRWPPRGSCRWRWPPAPFRACSARVDRLLTHTVSLAGLTALIVVAYLLALAAFGRKPTGSERSLLLLSMLAAAGAALAYQPARAWLTERANRVVYGERVSPDEALRTWGMRLTRAIPLDELLLQLAETLRKSMQLRSAQIWTGADGHYEVAAMVPHRALAPYFVGEKERVVVSRAGVSGGTWLDIWLPGLRAPAA